ncbi:MULTISPECIES: palindromic element RPE1 domain-containing protein [unclassified Candidatus Tisiphia]|uniref:palindromic element RPE1 domain-containing protein n=1 Tax=unclassified Candidatus Tisiphia TaxID=2996318 RepID=UPI00312C7CEA
MKQNMQLSKGSKTKVMKTTSRAKTSKEVSNSTSIKLPAKIAHAEKFEGNASPRTVAYSSVREDSSTALTYKLPAEVEFCRKPNKFPVDWSP